MKLYPLEPTSRTYSHIAQLARKLKIEIIAEKPPRLDSLVILGNGTPDDIVFSLVAYHLDGDKTVGVVKPPGRTGTSALEFTTTYLRGNRGLKKVLLLLDQDEKPLKQISQDARKCLGKQKQHIRVVKVQHEEKRLRVCECAFEDRTFKLILVVNGLDEIKSKSKKHAIEDHLLKVTGIDLDSEIEDPKEIWQTFEQSQKDEVLKKLKESQSLTKEILPQQVKAGEILKSG